MTQFYSRNDVNFTGDVYSIPFSYLKKEEVKVYIDDELWTDWHFLNESQLTLDSVPEDIGYNNIISVRRETDIAEKVVDYSNNSLLNKENLNKSQDQLLFAVQEIYDNNTQFEIDIKAEVDEKVERVTGAVEQLEKLEDAVETAISSAAVATQQAGISTDKAEEAQDILDEITILNQEAIENITTTKENALNEFNQHSTKVNYLFVMPIGHIGFSPFPIDETKGLQRKLNGQIIIQEQFTGFVKWLKDNIELYPQMACTEEQWQATVTMSVFGQCGKFVIDDEAGTIRLPRITGFIQGLTDFASLGELVEGKLPGITTKTSTTTSVKVTVPNTGWTVTGTSLGTATKGTLLAGSGSGEKGETLESINATSATRAATVTQGATSTSTSTYSDNKVQPEAIRYPYFIQVATGVEETIDTTREIELNNPFFFGYYQYFEFAPNNISWLKSQGQWNSKAVYNDYYNWILLNVNNGVANFKLSTDTYDDYCWVVNTADETFRLPLKTNNLNNSIDVLNLYFYVGETIQNANLINAGRIEEVVVNKLNRTGDTMTGQLTVMQNGNATIATKCSDLAYTDTPTTSAGFGQFAVCDKNGDWIALYGAEMYNNGRNLAKMQVRAKDGTHARIQIWADGNNQFYCDFPKCTTKATTTSSAKNGLVAVVVENYVNGTSWRRVWSDGWKEQGGFLNKDGTITFTKAFSNTNYNLTFGGFNNTGANNEGIPRCIKKTTTAFAYSSANYAHCPVDWYACGY